MAFDEQYRGVIVSVAGKHKTESGWPAVAIRFPPSGPTQFEWLGTPPTDTEVNNACAAFDADAYKASKERADALALLASDTTGAFKLARAIALAAQEVTNDLSDKIKAIMDVIDGASNLADVKTGVGALADPNTYTKGQMVTKITNIINAGDADTGS